MKQPGLRNLSASSKKLLLKLRRSYLLEDSMFLELSVTSLVVLTTSYVVVPVAREMLVNLGSTYL